MAPWHYQTMVISRSSTLCVTPRSTQAAPKASEPADGFTPSSAGDRSVSWFHRTTGALAGAGGGAMVGTALLGPMGNGLGGDGLIYPAVGFMAGAAAGLIGGAVLAGKFSSDEHGTSAFHRTTAVVAGAVVGSVVGMLVLGPAGNGKGADGLLYGAMGLLGGAAAGGIGGGVAAGHFPDQKCG